MNIKELFDLDEKITQRTSPCWILTKRPDGTAQVYAPSMGPCRKIVPIAETTVEFGEWLIAFRNALTDLTQATGATDCELILRLHADPAVDKAPWCMHPNGCSIWTGEEYDCEDKEQKHVCSVGCTACAKEPERVVANLDLISSYRSLAPQAAQEILGLRLALKASLAATEELKQKLAEARQIAGILDEQANPDAFLR